MDLVEEIFDAIQANRNGTVEDPKPLDFIKYISRTDMIKIKDAPAVLILENPFDFMSASNGPAGTYQEVSLFLLLKSKTANDLTEDTVKTEAANMLAKVKLLLSTLDSAVNYLTYGKTEFKRILIDSVPYYAAETTIKGTYSF